MVRTIRRTAVSISLEKAAPKSLHNVARWALPSAVIVGMSTTVTGSANHSHTAAHSRRSGVVIGAAVTSGWSAKRAFSNATDSVRTAWFAGRRERKVVIPAMTILIMSHEVMRDLY